MYTSSGVRGGVAGEQGIERSEDVVALIMMVMAAAISAYALYVYLQRSRMLKESVEEVIPPPPTHKDTLTASSVSICMEAQRITCSVIFGLSTR